MLKGRDGGGGVGRFATDRGVENPVESPTIIVDWGSPSALAGRAGSTGEVGGRLGRTGEEFWSNGLADPYPFIPESSMNPYVEIWI